MASDEDLSWLFQIYDEMSGPAKAMNTALAALEDRLKTGTVAADHMGEAHKKAGEHSDSLLHKFHDMVELGYELGEVLKGIAEHLVDVGREILHAGAAAEKTMTSFKLLFGPEAAAEIGEWVGKVSQTSAFSERQLNTMISELGTSGLKIDQIKRAVATAADVAALRGGDAGAAASEVTEAFSRIARTGAIHIARGGVGGVSKEDLIKLVMQQVGGTAAEVEKKIGAGGIPKDVLFKAIEMGVMAKAHETTLGGAGAIAGKQMDALLKDISQLPDLYFKSFASSPGWAKMEGGISKFLAAVNPESVFGKAMIEQLSGAFDRLITALFGNMDTATIQSTVEKVVDAIVRFIDAIPPAIEMFKEWWPTIKVGLEIFAGFAIFVTTAGWIKGLGEAFMTFGKAAMFVWEWAGKIWTVLEYVVAGLEMLFDASIIVVGAWAALGVAVAIALYEIYAHWDEVKEGLLAAFDWLTNLGADFIAAGVNLIEGLWTGIKGRVTQLYADVKEIANYIADVFSSALGIHSPSTVFAAMGGNVAAGFAQGIEGGYDQIGDALAGMTAPENGGVSGGGGAPGGGLAGTKLGGGHSFSFQIAIDAKGGNGEEAEARVRAAVEELTPGIVESIMSQLATEEGAI